MPNEDQEVNKQEQVENQAQEQIVEPPVNEEARAQGWVPKEEFEGDEHKWVDAAEFVRRGELFKKIDNQNKELKEVKKTLQLLAQHNKKIEDQALQRALAVLKNQKKEALIEGDADQLIAIDDKIDQVKDRQRASKEEAIREVQEVSETHPEMAAWTQRNSWYLDDPAMKAYADTYGTRLALEKNLSPSEVLKEVEKKVKSEFPTKFRNPNREKPGAVEAASNKGSGKQGGYQPTEIERQVAKKFVKQGIFKSEQEYYKQLEG